MVSRLIGIGTRIGRRTAARQHAVLVGPPGGEARQVVEDLLRIGVEDVRAVLVDQQPGRVVGGHRRCRRYAGGGRSRAPARRAGSPAARPARCRRSRRRRSANQTRPASAPSAMPRRRGARRVGGAPRRRRSGRPSPPRCGPRKSAPGAVHRRSQGARGRVQRAPRAPHEGSGVAAIATSPWPP